jgi:O-antigen ligase
MWIGLYLAYSASALAALLVGALVAGALLWGRRGALVAVGALVLAAAVVAGLPQSRHWVSSRAESRWHDTTRSRTAPFATGAWIARDHPFGGVGSGGFERAYGERTAREGRAPAAWRSTPVVVAAETGAVGLLLLAWLLAEALLTAFRRAGSTFTGRAAATFGIMTAAIAVHSLFADMLLEDAMFWGLLALAAVARRVREPARD